MTNPNYRPKAEDGLEDTKRYLPTIECPLVKRIVLFERRDEIPDIYQHPKVLEALRQGKRVILARAQIPCH